MTEKPIKEFLLNDGRKLSIYPDMDPQDPRERDNIGKLCVRKHRHYKFPNELDYDWDSAEEDAGKLYEQYYIFELDCYEHTGICFSLAGQGMQCKFDTSKNCWFFAVPKAYNSYDWKQRDESTKKDNWEKVLLSQDEAMKVVKWELELWNKYLNWEVYWYVVEKKVKRTSEDWREEYERESEDSCRGFYELEDMLSEFKSFNPLEQ